MTYKDKEKSNKAAKERMQKMRRNKGVTSEGITNNTGLPDHILRDISIAVKAYGDIKGQPSLKERIRKALEYQEWAKGQPRPGVLRDVTV